MSIPKLTSIYFNPTSYCNLKCAHCWINPPFRNEPLEDKRELTFDEIQSMIQEAITLGLKSVKFTGGEPFLRHGIVDIMKMVSNQGLKINIETNGTLIDENTAEALSEIKKKDPDLFIAVSLDGDESTHDSLRNKRGAFKDAIMGIENLLKHDIRVQVIFSLSSLNENCFDEVCTISENLRVKSLKVNFVNNIERGKLMSERGNLLSVERILSINDEITKINSSFPFPVMTNLPPAFKKIPKMMRSGRCGIFNIMGVLADGSVSICGIGTSKKNLIAGNVKGNALKDLWENASVFKNIRNKIPAELKGICGRCILKAFCLGECRADAYYKTNSFCSAFEFCQNAYERNVFPKKWIMNNEHEKGF